MKVAIRQQEGQLSSEVRGLRKELLDVIVNLEAVIDYPEDDIEEMTFASVLDSVNKTQKELTNFWQMPIPVKFCVKVCVWPLSASPMSANQVFKLPFKRRQGYCFRICRYYERRY